MTSTSTIGNAAGAPVRDARRLVCEITPFTGDLDDGWDARVEATRGGDLVQTSIWAASRHRIGFRVYRFLATDPGGAIAAGCFVYVIRPALGLSLGSIPRGPLLFDEQSDTASQVVRQLITGCRRLGISLLLVQPPETAAPLDDALAAGGFRLGAPSLAPEATIRIDLSRSDDEVLATMTTMRRRNLRKALAARFEVGEEHDLSVFHRLHLATAHRHGFAPVTLDNLIAQWEFLAPRAMCACIVARHKGVPIAGIWLTRFGGTVNYKLPGWDAAADAPAHVNEVLHLAAIKWARQHSAHIYDLGGFDRRSAELVLAGSAMPSEFFRSSHFFKLAFGVPPILLPPARFRFTSNFVQLSLATVTQWVLAALRSHRLVQALRNGREGLGLRGKSDMYQEANAINVSFVLRWLSKNLKKKGALGLADFVFSLIYDYWFDFRYGTNTSGWIPSHQLRTTSANILHSIRYQATKSRPFRKLMRVLRLPESSVFVDVGSGKGKVLLIASSYRFRKIIGVEFAADLCEIARKNIKQYLNQGGSLTTNIEVVHSDIIDYKITGDEDVFYLYNPFSEVVVRAFLSKLEQSITARPRKVWVIYHVPQHAAVIDNSPIFRKKTVYFLGGTDFIVYESKPVRLQSRALSAE